MSTPLPLQPPPKPTPAPSVHHFDFTYRYLASDVVIRYALLAAWRYLGLPIVIFWISQVALGIGLAVFGMEREARLRAKHSIAKGARVEPRGTSWVILWILLSIHAGYQTFGIVGFQPFWLRVTSVILLTAIASIYYVVVALSSFSDSSMSQALGEPYDAPEDENDRVLIRLRTELAAQERRIESYTVESTLIGALAFSAFVTIASSEKVVQKEAVGEAALDFSKALAMLVSLNLGEAATAFKQLSAEKPVLAIVATLSLTCSTFFLAVIVARLRFNSLVGLASYSTEVASALNQKEEDLYLLQLSVERPRPDLDARLAHLRDRIRSSLEEARLISQQLAPIVLYMTVFRHLGVLTFLLALVASAIWVSPALATAFAGISLLAYSYPALDRKLRDHNLLRHAFFRLPTFLRR